MDSRPTGAVAKAVQVFRRRHAVESSRHDVMRRTGVDSFGTNDQPPGVRLENLVQSHPVLAVHALQVQQSEAPRPTPSSATTVNRLVRCPNRLPARISDPRSAGNHPGGAHFSSPAAQRLSVLPRGLSVSDGLVGSNAVLGRGGAPVQVAKETETFGVQETLQPAGRDGLGSSATTFSARPGRAR